MRSTDNGASWFVSQSQPVIPPGSIVELVRADSDTAWVLATDDNTRSTNLAGTTDGGETWQSMFPPTTGCVSREPKLSFFDRRHIWFVCAGGPATIQERRVVSRSDDGGVTWRTTSAAVESGHFSSLAVADRDVAFIGQCRNTAVVSRDGGATWAPTVADNATAVPFDGCLSPVLFLDSNHGWAGGQNANQKPLVWRTDDGGVSWTAVELP